jgi:F-type H+-transporting ATPase subunit a
MELKVFFSPLEQFELLVVKPITIGSLDFSITNLTLSLIIVTFILWILFCVSVRSKKLVPNKLQRLAEVMYMFVNNLVKQQAGIQGLQYFPLFFVLFYFILFFNIVGLIPFGFTNTSQICYTFTLGFSMFIGVTIIGLVIHKLKFFNRFVPDITGPILPLIVVIEVFSYLVRPFSLSIRLFANMVAGHTLLHILAGFAMALFKSNFIFGFLMGVPVLAICVLEFGIAFLQAYVFLVLVCIYLKESIYGH